MAVFPDKSTTPQFQSTESKGQRSEFKGKAQSPKFQVPNSNFRIPTFEFQVSSTETDGTDYQSLCTMQYPASLHDTDICTSSYLFAPTNLSLPSSATGINMVHIADSFLPILCIVLTIDRSIQTKSKRQSQTARTSNAFTPYVASSYDHPS